MRKIFFLCVLCGLCSESLSAQITTVTGTITDPNNIPYAGATLKAQLTLAGAAVTGQPTVTVSSQAQCISAGAGNAPCQIPFQGTVGPITLDPTGSFTLNLQDNTLVLPGGTTWTFSVTISPGQLPPLGFGPQRFSGPLTISGASQSVSVALSALAPVLTRLSTCVGCGGGGAGVTSFSYAETGIDPLYSATVTNPTTTPLLTETANSVQPGMVLAGPIPTGSATNPSFESATANASTVNGTSVSVSGAPAAATTAAIFFGTTGTAQNVPAPSVGTWTVFPGTAIGSSNSHPLFSNLSSSARITPTSTIGVSDSWSSSLAFLGGSITSIPQSTPSSTSCGTGCATTTFSSPVVAGHVIVVYGYWASATAVPKNIRATDTLGNVYTLMSIAANLGNNGHFAMVAQSVLGGTPTITVTATLSVLFGGLVAFELAGPTSYYTGPNGPWQFRYLDSATLQASGLATGIFQYFTQNLVADIAGIANNSTTTLLTQAVTFPATGCPCRAQIMYGAAVTSGNSHVFETWISDGTNTGGDSAQEYVNTGPIYSSTATTIFPNSTSATYGNGQAVTFTLNLGITTLSAGSVTAKQLSQGGRQATWMQISILPTQN